MLLRTHAGQWRANLLAVDAKSGGDSVEAVVQKSLADFEAGMVDDLNTPRACAALFALVKASEKMLKSDSMDVAGECCSGFNLTPLHSVLVCMAMLCVCGKHAGQAFGICRDGRAHGAGASTVLAALADMDSILGIFYEVREPGHRRHRLPSRRLDFLPTTLSRAADAGGMPTSACNDDVCVAGAGARV